MTEVSAPQGTGLEKFGDFTDAEQECISRKIKKLRDEGKDQEQAVAIAISMCAPGKAQKHQAFRSPMGYRASWRDGGKTLVVHDVPIFCECYREPPEGAETFNGHYDAAWIRAVVARGRASEAEGYCPPLHVWHHDDPRKEPIAAGHFGNLRAGPIRFQGTSRLAVLADLFVTNPTVQQEILDKRLPYRSIEIYNCDKPKIDSLALLDHEAPFLELPMLMVAEVKGQARPERVENSTFGQSWQLDHSCAESPVLACFRRATAAHLLFHDSPGVAMADNDEDKKPDEKDEDKDKSEEMQAAETSEQDAAVEAVCQALKDGSITASNLARLQQDIMGLESATAPELAGTPAAPGGEAMKAPTGGELIQVAKMQAKFDALEAKYREREDQEKRKDAVGEAMKRLADRPLGALDTLEKKLGAFYDAHGPAAFKAYVDDLHANVAPSRARHEAPENFTTQHLSPVVMAYQEVGPEHVDRAAAFSAEWHQLREQGYSQASEEAFVAFHMGRLGVFLPRRTGS